MYGWQKLGSAVRAVAAKLVILLGAIAVGSSVSAQVAPTTTRAPTGRTIIACDTRS